MMKKLVFIAIALIPLSLLVGCTDSAPSPTTYSVPPSLVNKVNNTEPVELSSIEIIGPSNPAGPTIKIELIDYGTEPVVALKAVLQLEGEKTFTYDFPGVSANTPLKLGATTSQTLTLVGPTGYNDATLYPLTITVTLQNGNSITYTYKIQIKNAFWVK